MFNHSIHKKSKFNNGIKTLNFFFFLVSWTNTQNWQRTPQKHDRKCSPQCYLMCLSKKLPEEPAFLFPEENIIGTFSLWFYFFFSFRKYYSKIFIYHLIVLGFFNIVFVLLWWCFILYLVIRLERLMKLILLIKWLSWGLQLSWIHLDFLCSFSHNKPRATPRILGCQLQNTLLKGKLNRKLL